MDEEELDLVQDRFEDVSVDDQPLDIASEAGSYFEESEMRNHLVSEDDSSSRNRYRPALRIGGQLATINEANESRSNLSVMSHNPYQNNFGSSNSQFERNLNSPTKLNDPSENSNDFSFGNARNAIDQYENQFFSEENRANVLFQEDDRRFRETVQFEKENSWEPSIVVYEKQPSPEIKNSSSLLNKSERRKNEEDMPQSSQNVLQPANEQIFRESPEKSSVFGGNGSPMNRTVGETKTSTPKRPVSSRYGVRGKPPQLEISTISSIHPGSPTQTFAKSSPSDQSAISNSFLNNLIKNSKGNQNLMSALETARARRDNPSLKFDLRRNMSINRINNAIEPSYNVDPKNTIGNVLGSGKPSTTSSVLRENENIKQVEVSMHQQPTRPLSSSSSASTLKNGNYTENRTGLLSRAESTNGRESADHIRAASRTSAYSGCSGTSARSDSRKAFLKINVRRLAFGAVEIGDTLCLELEMSNVSDRTLRVKSTLDSTTKAFEIVDNRLAMIEPGKTSKIRVSFRPECAGRYHVLLKIDLQTLNIPYRIPMWGCGGVAKVAPVVNNELTLSNTGEYVMRSSNFSRISFKIGNTGEREGFARIDIFDSTMKPVRCDILPSRGLFLPRKSEKVVEIRLGDFLPAFTELRSSSAMSSVSTSSRRNNFGADVVIEIKWGEEFLRQRLKMLEVQMGTNIEIDGYDFTKMNVDEKKEYRTDKGMPVIIQEDKKLFEASYRTTNILLFSTRSSRQLDGFRSSNSLDPNECTIFETTAFRHHTFFTDTDVTIMPRK